MFSDLQGCRYCPSTLGSSILEGTCIEASDRCGSSQYEARDSCPNPYFVPIIISVVLYLAAFSPGMGTVPWCVNAEIFPIEASFSSLWRGVKTNKIPEREYVRSPFAFFICYSSYIYTNSVIIGCVLVFQYSGLMVQKRNPSFCTWWIYLQFSVVNLKAQEKKQFPPSRLTLCYPYFSYVDLDFDEHWLWQRKSCIEIFLLSYLDCLVIWRLYFVLDWSRLIISRLEVWQMVPQPQQIGLVMLLSPNFSFPLLIIWEQVECFGSWPESQS